MTGEGGEAGRGSAQPTGEGSAAGSGPPPKRRLEDELARVQVELAAQAADATPLSELGRSVRDVSRIQPLLEQVLDAVADIMGTEMAVVWVTDSTQGEVYPAAWRGLPDDYIAGVRVPVGVASAGRAVAQRSPVLVLDVATDPSYEGYREGALAHGIRSVYSVPMLTLTGEPMGALTTYSGRPGAPGERERLLAATLARQAGEMVERARMYAETRELAGLERRRGLQLRALADASLALTSAETLDELLRLVTETAVDIVGCHQGVASRLPTGWGDASTYVSLSETYAAWRDYAVVPQGLGVVECVTRENRPLRLTAEQLHAHPDWRGLRDAPDHPPLPDYLAAPLIGRDGGNLGLVQLSHKLDDTPFTAEDEAILVQLSQLASAALERLAALDRERAARHDAEQAALLRGVLSEASAVFAERFDPQGIAAALVELVVPRLAQVSVLHVLDDAGDLVLEASHAADPSLRRRLRTFFAAAPVLLDVPYGPAAALATGRPQLASTTTPQMLRAVTRTDEQADKLSRILGRSNICVPLTARSRTLGVLSLSRDEPYDDGDVEHALDLARRAALALDNASRYAFERDLAVTLQRSLLPRKLPTGKGFRAAARYLSGARGTEVGGDWYDVVEVGDALVLVVGDVVGRGVQAAAVMGQLQATVRAYALDGHGPAEVLSRLDRVAQTVPDLHFTTCAVARLEPSTGQLVVASAGHLPPVVTRAEGGARLLDVEPGIPLGVGGARYVDQSYQLEPGAMVLLYTDGLVEERDASLSVGLDRLLAALAEPVLSAEEACERVLRALGRDVATDDDTAVLAVYRRSDSSAHRGP